MKNFYYIIFTWLLFLPQLLSAQADLCSGATVIAVGSTCSYTAYSFPTGFGSEIGAPSCSACTKDAWFQFTATSSYTTVSATAGNSYVNISLTAYSGACGSLVQQGCINASGAGGNEYLTFPTTIGTVYRIRICRVNGNCSFLESLLGCSNTTAGTICVIQSSAPVTNVNCSQSVTICGNGGLASNNVGFGIQELNAGNQGCLINGEHQSNWYAFSPSAPGTIAFTINPLANIDYDFAIWGPLPSFSCPVAGTPLRCSYAAPGGSPPTGLQAGAGDITEGAAGDGFVDPIVVTPAQVGMEYIMVIDNWTANGVPFTLTWNLSGGASLDCTPLPVVLSKFDATAGEFQNLVTWSTSSEINNDYFLIEKSDDALTWKEAGRVKGAGNSNQLQQYELMDPVPYKTTYYRLTQVDYDGITKTYNIVTVNRTDQGGSKGNMFAFYPNPVSSQVNIQTYYEGKNTVNIVNQVGRVVYSGLIYGVTNFPLDLSAYEAGLYFISIENEGKVQNEKMIISK